MRMARMQEPIPRLSDTWYPMMERVAAFMMNQAKVLTPRILMQVSSAVNTLSVFAG